MSYATTLPPSLPTLPQRGLLISLGLHLVACAATWSYHTRQAPETPQTPPLAPLRLELRQPVQEARPKQNMADLARTTDLVKAQTKLSTPTPIPTLTPAQLSPSKATPLSSPNNPSPLALPTTTASTATPVTPAPSTFTPTLASSVATSNTAPPAVPPLAPAVKDIAEPALGKLYARVLSERLSQQTDYPSTAAMRGWQGLVQIRITLSRQGDLLQAQIANSSGFAVLDQHALQRVKEATPLPTIAGAGLGDPLHMLIPVHYRLERS